VDGGELRRQNSGEFNLATGRDLTARNNAQVDFEGGYDILANNTFTFESGADFSLSAPFLIGDGMLLMDGAGSTLTVSGTGVSKLGFNGGMGNLTVSNGAAASFAGALRLADDVDVNSIGQVAVNSGADLTVGALEAGTRGFNGQSGTIIVQGAGSSITQTGAAQLVLGAAANSPGVLNVLQQGMFTTGTGGATIHATGQINLNSGGVFDARGPINMNGGAFNFLGGTLHAGVFNGNLVNQGGALAPGASAGDTTIIGNYTQQAEAKLQIEIGGPLVATQHDFVNVTGTALLDGELELALINDFVPTPSQTFTVLSAGGLLGFFDNVTNGQRLATSNGVGSFLVHYGPTSSFNPNQIVLSAFQPAMLLAADFDEDGDVDGADLTRWKAGFGASSAATHMQGNADGDADVDGSDFLVWQRQLGGLTPSAAASSAVPEPSPLLFAALAAGRMVSARRDRRRRFGKVWSPFG